MRRTLGQTKRALARFAKGMAHHLHVRMTRGMLESHSKAFDALFPPHAMVQFIATGFQFTEGPIWFKNERRLLFSDIPANKIFSLSSAKKVQVFRSSSGHSNGLTRDKQGRLIACEHGNRRVSRTEQDGSLTVLADTFRGKRLNSPNDIVVKRDGAIYFTDPIYGIKTHEQEQPVRGVYRLSPYGQKLALLVDDFEGPNGLAFSPDETKLYIDDSSSRRHIRVFSLRSNGSLTGGKIFHDMKGPAGGPPDGMKVDTQGHVYSTGPGGLWVLDPDGSLLGIIRTPEAATNCAWGDDDWKSLYITAQTSVYRVRVNVPGIKVP
jgi:gluconolactonase